MIQPFAYLIKIIQNTDAFMPIHSADQFYDEDGKKYEWDCYLVQSNTDFGGDLYSHARVSSRSQCERKCGENPGNIEPTDFKCKGYTYDKSRQFILNKGSDMICFKHLPFLRPLRRERDCGRRPFVERRGADGSDPIIQVLLTLWSGFSKNALLSVSLGRDIQ